MLSLFRRDQFAPVKPWPKPALSACRFYHSFTFPNGEDVTGLWDLRGCFDDYVGHYPLAAKTVLDFGTASGFLAFSAEQRGATVTAFEAASPVDLSFIPFAESRFWTDRAAWARDYDIRRHRPRKQSYWYAWRSTPVDPTDEPVMRPAFDFATAATDRAWWLVSHGLYRRVLDNLGFDMTLCHCTSSKNPAPSSNDTSEPEQVTRPTIVARRR